MYKMVPLSDFVSLSQGLAINKGTAHLVSEEKKSGFSYPLLRIADMMDNSFSKYISDEVNPSVIARKDDIIYTRTGQIGLAFRGFCGCVHNNSFIVHLVNNAITKDYLFVVLNSDFVRNQALSLAKNSVQPDLTHDMFKSIVIPVPELEEQEVIVKSYFSITDKINLNNAICSDLESMAKLLYDYWFVQFDFPDENGKPYKSSGGKMIWNEELKREIPKGWTIGTMLENPLFGIIKPGVLPFDRKEYIATAEVNGTTISQGSTIEFETRENRANMQPTENSVWFAKMKNSIKHMFLNREMQFLIEGAIFSTGFCGLQCSNDSFEYIASIISDPQFEYVKDLNSHGATMAGINNDDLDNIYIIVPPQDELSRFHSVSAPLFSKMSHCIEENRQLASLRNFLLPMLMNGQVKVGGAAE